MSDKPSPRARVHRDWNLKEAHSVSLSGMSWLMLWGICRVAAADRTVQEPLKTHFRRIQGIIGRKLVSLQVLTKDTSGQPVMWSEESWLEDVASEPVPTDSQT